MIGTIIGGVITVVICIFFIVCYWRVWEKCGLPGWASIIPFYNMISLSGALGMPILGILNAVFTVLYLGLFFTKFVLLAIPVCIGLFVVNIIMYYNLAKGLGFAGWFVLVMLFLPFIAFPIMAFSK